MKVGNLEVYGVIYKITNKVNGKVYIGQTIKGFDRRYKHDLKKNTHNEHLRYSIHKYGIENFDICKEFDYAFSKEELDVKEMVWINYYKATNRKYGYNLMSGGANGKHSEETKQKISKIIKIQLDEGLRIPLTKKVICLNNLEIFDSMKDACETYDCNINQMVRCCKHEGLSCGEYNNERLLWMYYDEYLESDIDKEEISYQIKYAKNPTKGDKNYNYGKHLSQETINKIKKTKRLNGDSKGEKNPMFGKTGYNNPNSKNIICITTNEVFANAVEASKTYKCDSSGITKCCKGKRKSCGKLEDGTKLQWMYYEDYLNLYGLVS